MPDIPKIDIRPDHWEIVRSILQKYVPQYAVWAFGSRAKWTAKEYSDLDLAIITDKPLSLDICASLSDDFSESDLPYKVDVVDWATTTESFRKIIERDRVVVQEAGWDLVMNSTRYQKPTSISQLAGLLGDFVEFKNGRSSPERNDLGIFTVYGSNGEIGKADVSNASQGTLVVGRVGSYCGSVHYSPKKCWVTDNAIIGSSRSPKDSRFWFYKLASLDLNNYRAGSGQPLLNQQILNSIPVTVPASEDDRFQIARVLAAFDDKINLNHRINQTLEAMAQAIFKSWFVDFDPVKAKIAAIAEGRDPLRAAMSAISGKPEAQLDALPPEQYDQLAATAALFPDEMEEPKLGDIPRGWSVSKVETLLLRLSAKARYTKEQVSAYGQIPVFEQGASILLGYHNGVASYPASAESPLFIFGDHTCVTRLSFQPFDISQNVIPLQGKDRATAWVYYAVKEKQKFQEYRRHWMELISKDVVIATADVCLEFSKRITKLHLQIEANERQMQSLRELRDTLLPKLLSGELSVTEAAAEVEA